LIHQRIRLERGSSAELNARLRNLHPRQRLGAERTALQGLKQRLVTAQRASALARRNTLARAVSALEMLSPVACLERGYSIVKTADGHVVSQAEHITAGESVNILLHRGSVDATVDRVAEHHELERQGG
jgi:exodeoxyribonuclease VII large subunit